MIKFSLAIKGVEQLRRSLQLADPKTRERAKAAIQKNTKAVRAGAEQRAPAVSGEMKSTIRDEYSADGLTGYVKVGQGKLPRRSRATTERGKQNAGKRSKKIGKGAYAPVVERGDRRTNRQPHPFLIPPFMQQRPTAIADINRALNDSLDEVKGA